MLFCFIALTISVQAQGYVNSRLKAASDLLVTQASDLSSRSYNDFRSRRSSTRTDLDALFLAQQFESSARLFQQMIQDNRRSSELQDAAAILSDLSRRAPGFGSNSNQWRDVKNSVNTIQREVGSGYGNRDDDRNDRNDRDDNRNNDTSDRRVSGRVTWRGTVDDEVQLSVQGRNVETRTISGSEFTDDSFNFTSALPNRNVTVEVNKKKGRGDVRVLQQPSRSNNYTAVIRIEDKKGSNDIYELDIYWY